MDIVTLGAALNGSAEYVNSHFKSGSNIQIVDNPDGTQTINASGEVSAEDTVAREAIAEHVLDKANPHEVTATQLGLGNVNNTSDIDKPVSTAMQTALNTKANTTDVYSKNEVDTALGSKQNVITDLADIRSGAALGSTAVQPVSGKGLSTNDYTTTEKNKLAGIEAQANKTTVDSSLSGTSTNPVQNKVVKSALDGKQDALSTEQLAAVNSGIMEDDVTQIETNKNNILSIYNTGFAQKNVMRIVLDEVKALLPSQPFVGNTTTFGNLSVTFNEDNSITLNGSHTAAVAINFKDLSHINMPTNAVGAASANITLSNDIFFGLWGDSGVSNLVLNNGVDIPSDYASKYSRGFVIRVSANTVCNNVRIYPMVCDKALYQASSEVVPYTLPNTAITPALKRCVDNGAKNRLPATSTTTSTNNGLTLVVNSDYSITITGTMITAEDTDIYFLGSRANISPFANYTGKNMRIYCKSSASIDGQFKMYDGIAMKGYAVAINNNEGVDISGDLTAAYFTIAATVNAINVTLHPMICDPALWAVSQQYEPYAMSNAEITAWILAHS